MKKVIAIIVIISVLPACCLIDRCTDDRCGEEERTEIGSAMAEQVESWNSGDLAGFMKYYWRSEDMTFHGGKKRLQGWGELNSMYVETYSGEQRGILEFSGLEITVLSNESAYVLGDWKVELPDTVKQGKFTLIWRRLDEGWRIVHDHSS